MWSPLCQPTMAAGEMRVVLWQWLVMPGVVTRPDPFFFFFFSLSRKFFEAQVRINAHRGYQNNPIQMPRSFNGPSVVNAPSHLKSHRMTWGTFLILAEMQCSPVFSTMSFQTCFISSVLGLKITSPLWYREEGVATVLLFYFYNSVNYRKGSCYQDH